MTMDILSRASVGVTDCQAFKIKICMWLLRRFPYLSCCVMSFMNGRADFKVNISLNFSQR